MMDPGAIGRCIEKAGDVNAGVLLYHLILRLNEGKYAELNA